MSHLQYENCNKAKCKSCIFGPTPIELTQKRKNEIHGYLARFESSHICHTTNKTCYGALEYQAKIMYAMHMIEAPTAESLLLTANKYLNNE